MSRPSPFALGLAFPMALLSHSALADLTPAQVWGDWRSYLEGMGYEITATESTSGDSLSLDNINLKFAMPDGAGDMSMSLGALEFAQNDDGTVAVILPASLPMTTTGTDGLTGEKFSMTMTYSQTGHSMIASGSPEEITYDYNAATIAMTLDELTGNGEALGRDSFRMVLNGTNLQSSTRMTAGDMRKYDQSGSLDALSYDFFINDPAAPDEAGAIKGAINSVTFTGAGSVPLQIADTADVAAMLRDGFAVGGTFTYANGSSNFDIKDPENGNFVLETASQGGSLGFKMGQDGLTYDVSQTGLTMNLLAEAMPFPIQIAMANSGFKLDLPVAKSDDPQDFALGITLGDFTMSDIIWGIFDPAGQLPRDPATVLLDLSGKVKLLVDWMNPEVAAEIAEKPGDVQALDLNNLVISAAGARLDASGAVTFDGAGAPMLPTVGNPVGMVNFALAGGNGLLDKLVAMGLIPQEDAMGARMMMGLFTVPGDAPDTLKSKIEFTQDGQILANGQRIR